MRLDEGNGLTLRRSPQSVDETIAKLKTMMAAKGITLFALIDHSGEAAKVGLTMPATKLLIFGAPKAGTPLMLAAPDSAIDLPLKVLVREARDGVEMVYNTSAYLGTRYGLSEELLKNIAGVEAMVNKAAE